MALERIGIGGVLKFSADAAIGGMKRAGAAFGNLRKRAGRAKVGMTQLGNGVRAGVPAVAALTGGIAFMGLSAAKFEAQMSGVSSILDETNRKRLPELTKLAKQMGASTVFSATQAGEGIEAMARSGANAQDIMDGLGGVLNAAAADGIELGTASSIVSNIVNAMGLSFKDATRVADVLARTSSKSNTNIIGLGESFKFAAAQSKKMGIDLETTSAALGAIADSGLKGTLGGTSFTNMLVKLSKPSAKATAFMEKFGIKLTDADGKMRDIFDITQDYSKALGTINDDIERAAASTEIFGIRGDKAFSAISGALAKEGPKNLRNLRKVIQDSAGAAKEMAEIRLDNLLGSFTLLKSAAEGLFIEVFGPHLPKLKEGVQRITTAVQQLVTDLQNGVQNGRTAWAKWAGGAAIATAIIAPLLLAVGLFASLITTAVIPAISGLFTIISAVGAPILAAAAVGIFIWKVFGAEIRTFATGLKTGLMPIIGMLKDAWVGLMVEVSVAFESVRVAWNSGTQGMSTDMTTFGESVALVIGFILEKMINMVSFTVKMWGMIITGALAVRNAIWTGINAPLKFFLDFILNLQDAWTDLVNGSILKGIAKIGLAIIDQVLVPFRALVRMAVKFGKSIGFDVPEKLARFAEQGFSGLAFGRDDVGAVPTAQAPGAKAAPKRQASPAARASAAAAKSSKDTDNTTKELSDAIKKLSEKQKIELTNNVCVDGREVAIASERHKVELQERAGFKATPWQRRMAIEAGGVPVAAAG